MNVILKLFTFALFAVVPVKAADILITFDPSQAQATLDPAFHDFESAVFNGQSTDSRVVATLAGRDYVQDPLAGEIWGLLDNSKPWNEGRPGWLVRQGWESNVLGVPVNHQADGDVPAAYLLIKLTRPEDLMFDSVTVIIDRPINSEFLNNWGSSSADGNASFSVADVVRTSSSETLTLTLSNLNFTGGDPLEIKVYGVLGEDDGTFGIQALVNAVPLIPVPEPGSLVLLGVSCCALLRRRR